MALEFQRFLTFGDGTTVAEFKQRFEKEPWRFNRPSLADRVANLKRNGADASVEESVLAAWPPSTDAEGPR